MVERIARLSDQCREISLVCHPQLLCSLTILCLRDSENRSKNLPGKKKGHRTFPNLRTLSLMSLFRCGVHVCRLCDLDSETPVSLAICFVMIPSKPVDSGRPFFAVGASEVGPLGKLKIMGQIRKGAGTTIPRVLCVARR